LSSFSNVVHEGAGEKHDEHDNNLVDALRKNCAHHRFGDNSVSGLNTFGTDIFSGVFSGESDGGEDIHDQVDPEELHNAERSVAKEKSGNEDKGQAGEVDSHLELNEFTNVVLNVATPFDGGNDGEEVIIHEDNIGVILGSGAAILTHGETNIGLGESASVGQTFASNANH